LGELLSAITYKPVKHLNFLRPWSRAHVAPTS
jgi:hypothetical protein